MSEFPVPAMLIGHALAFKAGDPVVEPRRAATVALLRDTDDGIEAYLLRRVRTMGFAAGMHVFPGGAVDPRDSDRLIDWAGPPPSEWADRLGFAGDGAVPDARAVVSAAVREVYEESGVLLAGGPVEDVSGDEWEAARLALIARELSLVDFLGGRELALRSDLLGFWSRWITPEFEPRRYDTYFFVAALPPGQVTRDVGGEADRVVWLRPADALKRWAAGELPMLPPTVVTLSQLAGFESVADVLAAAAVRDAATPIRPHMRLDTDPPRLVIQ